MSWRDVPAEWRSGREHGFPLCCIARFCWDIALGREPGLQRPGDMRAGYVPCGWLHHPSPGNRWFWHRLHRGDHFAGFDGETGEIIERTDPRWNA